MSKSSWLRELITSPEPLVMPDAYDPLSARLIESVGVKAVQCSGYSMALAGGCPSEAALGLERNLTMTKAIVEAVDVPVMADGEDAQQHQQHVHCGTESVRRCQGEPASNRHLFSHSSHNPNAWRSSGLGELLDHPSREDALLARGAIGSHEVIADLPGFQENQRSIAG